jgi:hypothetical protein
MDIFPNEPAPHFEYAFHCLVEAEGLGADFLFAGKSEQLPGDTAVA